MKTKKCLCGRRYDADRASEWCFTCELMGKSTGIMLTATAINYGATGASAILFMKNGTRIAVTPDGTLRDADKPLDQ